jgi:chondroitin polymerizing factor
MKNLNKEILNRYSFKNLINGYKQFDPTRGAQYILDLLLYDNSQGIELHKRVNLMRPLGLVEIIPMPYVTESAKINIIVPFTLEYDENEIEAFFLNYDSFVLEMKEIAEKVNIFVVYVITENQMYSQREREIVSYVNNKITDLNKKYPTLLKTSQIIEYKIKIENISMYFSESYRQMSIVEHFSIKQNLSSDSLMLITPPCVEFQSEFLNRVRLNTIKDTQIFFPIPFNQFMPNIIYDTFPFPDHVEIHKAIGYFNTFTYNFASFYISDYLKTRKKYLNDRKYPSLNSDFINVPDLFAEDLYAFFATNRDLNIIRTTDQALKCRWHFIEDCFRHKGSNEEKIRCLKEKESSLGTKAQLAMHLMKNYDKIVK